MHKKILLSLGFVAILSLTTVQVMAHSTIYTDDIGRMHFLGKDPGAKTLQKVEDYDNPAQKDVTNAIYNASKVQDSDINESKVNVTKDNVEESASKEVKKTRGFFSARKGNSEASETYKYGGTDLNNAVPVKEIDQKSFWLW